MVDGFHRPQDRERRCFRRQIIHRGEQSFCPRQQGGGSRLDNERCAIVKVNDRMHARHRRRVIDVSLGVAEYLDMVRAGVVLVRVRCDQGGTNNLISAIVMRRLP
jgi:hypothetical protein